MNQNHSPQDIVVGLDIGTTKIACIVGQKNAHGKLEVIGYGRSESIGVTRGVVANIEQTVQSIRTAVEAAEKSANVRIEVVNVGIAGQHIKSLQHRGQLIRTETEEEINRQDVQQLIEDMKKLAGLGFQVIASGGVTTLDDVKKLREANESAPNLSGIIIGRALYEGTIVVADAVREAR